MKDADFDDSHRYCNKVKSRFDSNGDGWANAHRNMLDTTCLMQDVDCMFGALAFGHNTAERLFLEYVPDNYENRTESIRRFGIVALFDRKKNEKAMFHNRNVLSKAFYLWICRVIGEQQKVMPKFFYVIGDNNPPWDMIEIDVQSGKLIGRTRLEGVNWYRIWHLLGLDDLRAKIMQMIQ